MNLLADEGVDKAIVTRLRQEGHSVLYVAEMQRGISDTVVLDQANTHQALLLTLDKDFGELVYRQGLVHLGVILVRLEGMSAVSKSQIVADAVAHHESELSHAFTVISPGLVRIRKQTR